MKRPVHILIMGFVLATVSALAEDAKPQPSSEPGAVPQAPPPPDDAGAVVLAPKRTDLSPAADVHATIRPVSAGVASALFSGMPKFSPEGARPNPAAMSADRRDADKPKNAIPRIPVEVMSRYVVRGSRPPVFRNRDLYTPAGLVQLSFRNHPGLHMGNVFNSNAAVASAMYFDDERLENKQDLEETAYAMAAAGDLSEANAIMEATRDAYMRDEDHSGPAGIRK